MDINEKNLIIRLMRLREQNKQLEIYDVVDSYLNTTRPSIDLLLRLAIFFEQPPIVDEPKSIEFAESVLNIEPHNPFALIIIAFIYYYDIGDIPLRIYEELESINQDSPEIQSMIEIVKSWYLKNKDPQKYVITLEKSIALCGKYTKNFIDLGRYCIDHGNKEKGILLFKAGLANVKKIYNDVDKVEDVLKEFLDERIRGTSVTDRHYRAYLNVVKQDKEDFKSYLEESEQAKKSR